MFSNRHLLGGIGFSLAFAAAVVYLPVLRRVFGTAALPRVLTVVPFPFLVWGTDELRRAVVRHRTTVPAPETPPAPVPAGQPGPHHPLPTLLARHGWSAHRLSHALGIGEQAAAGIVAHAHRISAGHGRRTR
ncbi:cation transporting ATPase C-terminal domain-containing protein [Kitasatospora sp. NPDC054795]